MSEELDKLKVEFFDLLEEEAKITKAFKELQQKKQNILQTINNLKND
jgi:hypothetical protein